MPSGSEGTSANDLDAGIGRELEFLRRSQFRRASSRSSCSPDLNLERDCVFDSSPFPPALIAYSVGFDGSDSVDDVLKKALSFLLNLRARYR